MKPYIAVRLAIAVWLVLWLAIGAGLCLLCACGGGGEEPEADEQPTNILVDCDLHPEICK